MVSESETEPLGFLDCQLERHTVPKVVEESSVDLPPLFPGNYLLHLLVSVDYLMDPLDLWSLALSGRQEHSCGFTLTQAYVWSEQLNMRAHLHSEDEDIDQVLHAGGVDPVQLHIKDKLIIAYELDIGLDGIEVIPYRLSDWLSLTLWVFELQDKTSTPLYCTNCANISAEVTTLESINWCSISMNAWALYMRTKISSTESDNMQILWTSLDLPYLVQANLDSMVTN